MKCINKDCGENNNGICINKLVKCNSDCMDRKTRTLTYTEEQLEHAQDKENRCYNGKCVSNNKNGVCGEPKHITMCDIRDIDKPTVLNYEEEYNKLKKENAQLKEYNLKTTNEAAAIKFRNEELIKENEQLEKEDINKELRMNNQGTQLEESKKANILLNDNNYELTNQIHEKNNRIEELESINKDINELKENLEGYKKENNEHIEYIQEVQEELKELKKQNNQGYIEQMNITLKEKNEEIEKKNDIIDKISDKWTKEIEESTRVIKENNKLMIDNRKLVEIIDILKDSNIKLLKLI